MLAQTLHEFQTKEIEQIGKRIAAGLDSSGIVKRPDRLFAYYNQAKKRYIGLLKKVGDFGAAQVAAELKRQGA